MNSTEQKERNIASREGVFYLNESHGMRWDFMAKKVGMSYHSFANWKRGEYDFGKERLDKVDKLINKYKSID